MRNIESEEARSRVSRTREEDIERSRLLQIFKAEQQILDHYHNEPNEDSHDNRAAITLRTTVHADEHGAPTRDEILAAARELCEQDCKRQQHILEATERRSKEIRDRKIREQKRLAEKRQRELMLLESTTAGFAKQRASGSSTPQPAAGSSSLISYPPLRAATSLSKSPKKSKSHVEKRTIISQEELDRIEEQRRKALRDEINSRRIENINRQKELDVIAQLEKEKFEQELLQQALKKDELLLIKELEDRKYHYSMLDKIAAPPAGNLLDKQVSAVADVAEKLSSTINSTNMDPEARLKELNQLAAAALQRKQHKAVEERWREHFHRAAIQLESAEKQREHQKKMEHLELLRKKQLDSLSVVQARKKERQRQIMIEFENSHRESEEEFVQQLKENQKRFENTREEERKRLERVKEARESRQKEINQQVIAMKTKDLEDFQRAVAEDEKRQALFANESAEERERRIISVQKLKYAQYKRDEEERKLRWEQSERLRLAEEQRQQEIAEKRQLIEQFQTRHAGNRLRYRSAQREAQELTVADTEAFYTSAQQNRKPRPQPQLSHSNTPYRDRSWEAPREPELLPLESYRSGDVGPDVLSTIAAADEKMKRLQKR